MKTLIISNEFCKKGSQMLSDTLQENEIYFTNEFSSPLELVSEIISINPSVLVIDDDLTQPDSIEIIKSIKKINKDIATVFITSNSSVEFGRNVSPLGIQFYAIKPIEESDLAESINSIQKLLKKNTN
ncbi:MAG: response regulator [Ignavibacteria bacterium]|jgi:DNA-binding NarL/FixJ family response regulator